MDARSVPAADPDHALRRAAIHARELSIAYDDLVPLAALRQGFMFDGRRVSFGSFAKGDTSARCDARTGSADAHDGGTGTGQDRAV